MDTNGIINNTHSLETTDGVTTKTEYKADGYTINDNVTEKWEANFQNYEKVWTAPNGEKSILKAAGKATIDANGRYNVPVKREGIGASDEIFIMVFDKDGRELNRYDVTGNQYDSTDVLVKKAEEAPVPETTTAPIEVQPIPQKDEALNKETAPVETPKPIGTTAPIKEPQAPVEPETDATVDVIPKEKGLTKAGMYWAKTEYINGQTIKTLYYDEAGTRVHSKIMQNDTSGRKTEEFYNEAGKKTSSTVTGSDGSVNKKEY